MLTNIVNFLGAVFDTISNLLSGLVGIISSASNAIEWVFTVGALLPPILFGCITATVSILVIKFVLGR